SSSTSSPPTTTNDCQALQDAWNAASVSFASSVFSVWSASQGFFTPSIETFTYHETETDYSYDFSGLETITFDTTTVTDMYAASTVATITTTALQLVTDTYLYPKYGVPFPTCSVPYVKPTITYSRDCTGCTLIAPNVQLFYFPVSTVSGNPNLTITPTGTSVRTAVYDGNTFTSGSVYLKYDNVSADNGCLSMVGSFYPGALVTLRSDEVSSMRNDGTYFDGAYSFNYADLNYPVPYSAWAGQLGCDDDATPEECALRTEIGPYNPYISIPAEVQGLDPAWKTCTMDPLYGSWDPPYALMPAQGIFTDPGHVTTSTAIPANTPTSPQAQSTPVVPSTQSAGAMSPSNSKAVDPPSLPTSTAVSAVAPADPGGDPQIPSALSNSYVVSADPGPTLGGSQGDPSVQPSFSAKVVITISNSAFTLGPTATAIIPPSQTVPLPPSSIDLTASAIIINSETLAPGSYILVSGTTYSLLPTPSAIVIDGSTISLPAATDRITLPPAITIGTSVITENSASEFVIGSQTLTPGGQITASGKVVSMGSGAVVIDGSTISLWPTTNVIALPPAITVGASTITENSASDFVIGSQTLTPGGQITVSGEVISLNPSATDVVFGGTSTQGLGALIMSGFEPVGGPNATSTTIGIHFSNGEVSTRALGWWAGMMRTKVSVHVVIILMITIGF
ncbi:hypothetical protein MMC11_009086, partial [Xylographa trunciseda]|nr:hypothetical protein [Xylographa trunciseda]